MRTFLTLPDVAEALNISMSQTRALIQRGDLEGIQIGGAGSGEWKKPSSMSTSIGSTLSSASLVPNKSQPDVTQLRPLHTAVIAASGTVLMVG